MDLKKTNIRFGSNLFLKKKSESENKSESPAATNSNDSEYLWISRLTSVEKQNQEISRKFDEMKRQNDKLICQNEIILEMLETQMKLFLDLKSGPDGATTTFPISKSRNISDHPQTLAISNPLYKFNTNTKEKEKTRGEELSVGDPINQEPATGKRQLLASGRRQEKTKEKHAALIGGGKKQVEQQTTSRKQDEESESQVARSPGPQNEREVQEKTRSSRQYQRSKAVWQVIYVVCRRSNLQSCLFLKLEFDEDCLQVVKPLSSKTLGLQEQLLAELSTSLIRQVVVIFMLSVLMVGLELPQYRDQTSNKQGLMPFWFGFL